MQLTINGKDREVDSSLTIPQLLEELGIPSDQVVVELNRNILNANQIPNNPLRDGDSLELIQFVGGG